MNTVCWLTCPDCSNRPAVVIEPQLVTVVFRWMDLPFAGRPREV